MGRSAVETVYMDEFKDFYRVEEDGTHTPLYCPDAGMSERFCTRRCPFAKMYGQHGSARIQLLCRTMTATFILVNPPSSKT